MRRYSSAVRGLIVTVGATIPVIFGILILGTIVGVPAELVFLLSPILLGLNYFVYLKLPPVIESQKPQEKEAQSLHNGGNASN
ncbi:MAG: hypothetical protein ACFFBD_02155 [Candidatus Hodarchaeota archaeon]